MNTKTIILVLLLTLVLVATAQYYGGEEYQTFGDQFDGEDYYSGEDDDAQTTMYCTRCVSNYEKNVATRTNQYNACVKSCGKKCRPNTCVLKLSDIIAEYNRCSYTCT